MLPLAFLSLFSLVPLGALGVSVTLKNTVINGFYNATSNTDTYLGIPYAKPGYKRFMAAEPYSYSELGTINATQFSPACPQVIATETIVVKSSAKYGFSEDCLTLNVYVPAGYNGSEKLPVMVYLYGGAFSKGTSYLYDAGALVATSQVVGNPVIAVVGNYRVGVLGFLQGTTAYNNSALNAGLKDQRQVMQWVQENIKDFGGNKHKVTLFGESAGAMSVSYHLFNETQDYFKAAIMESGAPTGYPVSKPAVWDFAYNDLLGFTGCNTTQNSLECLQNANLSTIIAAATSLSVTATYGANLWGPAVDGDLIPDIPRNLMAEGKFSKVPMIMGNNKDEGTAFAPNASSEVVVSHFLAGGFPLGSTQLLTNTTVLNEFLSYYPDMPSLGSPFGTGNQTFGYAKEWKQATAMFGDLNFQGARRRFAAAAEESGVQLWNYEFVATSDPSVAWAGSYHSIELQWLFNTFDTTDPRYELSKVMASYWTHFAYNHHPNYPGGFKWKRYGDNKNLLQINTTLSTITDDYRQAGTDWINSHDQYFYPAQ